MAVIHGPDPDSTHPVSYPNNSPPVATNSPTMMAGAEDPATLSGLCQAMAIAMVGGRFSSGQRKMRLSSRARVRAKLSSMMITRFWSEGRRHPYWSTGVLAQGPVFLGNMPWIVVGSRGRESSRSLTWMRIFEDSEVEGSGARRARGS